MSEDNIKQHFRPDEATLIDQANDWVATAEGQYRPVLTPFLNPRERFIVQTIVNRNNNVWWLARRRNATSFNLSALL